MSNVPKDVEACCVKALGAFPILTVKAQVKLLCLCIAKKTSGSKTWSPDVAKAMTKDRTLEAMFPNMGSQQIITAAHALVKRHNRHIIDTNLLSRMLPPRCPVCFAISGCRHHKHWPCIWLPSILLKVPLMRLPNPPMYPPLLPLQPPQNERSVIRFF